MAVRPYLLGIQRIDMTPSAMVVDPRWSRRHRPNRFVMAPAAIPMADAPSPVIGVPLEALEASWRAIAAELPDFALSREDRGRHRYDYVARSRVLRFPDDVVVQLVTVEPGASSFLIASVSRYGWYDFGVNVRRVRRLAAALMIRTEVAPLP
jgi:uncharacterized protein (DUF1499 family)